MKFYPLLWFIFNYNLSKYLSGNFFNLHVKFIVSFLIDQLCTTVIYKLKPRVFVYYYVSLNRLYFYLTESKILYYYGTQK